MDNTCRSLADYASGRVPMTCAEWQNLDDALRMRAAIRFAGKHFNILADTDAPQATQDQPVSRYGFRREKPATGQETALKSEQEAKARGNGAECGKPAPRPVQTIDGHRWL